MQIGVQFSAFILNHKEQNVLNLFLLMPFLSIWFIGSLYSEIFDQKLGTYISNGKCMFCLLSQLRKIAWPRQKLLSFSLVLLTLALWYLFQQMICCRTFFNVLACKGENESAIYIHQNFLPSSVGVSESKYNYILWWKLCVRMLADCYLFRFS